MDEERALYPGAESDGDAAGSEDVESPLVGGARAARISASARPWKAVLPRVAGVAGLAVAAWVGTAAVARSSAVAAGDTQQPAEPAVRDVVQLEATSSAGQLKAVSQGSCQDTPAWTNGFYECATNGYKGKGCEPRGLNCQAYATNGWCANGATVDRYKDWAFGQHMNYPELNCCACGGGSGPSMQSGGSLAAVSPAAMSPAAASPAAAAASTSLPWVAPAAVPTLPGSSPWVSPAAVPTLPGSSAVASCAANPECAKAGLTGNCCPNDNKVQLECCSTPPRTKSNGGKAAQVCEDAPQWANGYVKCNTLGLTKDDGCTFGGMSCEGYVKQGFCANGKIVAGKEWTSGGTYNHPELNCCACGRASVPK